MGLCVCVICSAKVVSAFDKVSDLSREYGVPCFICRLGMWCFSCEDDFGELVV